MREDPHDYGLSVGNYARNARSEHQFCSLSMELQSLSFLRLNEETVKVQVSVYTVTFKDRRAVHLQCRRQVRLMIYRRNLF